MVNVKKKKTKYEEPSFEVILFSKYDYILTSGVVDLEELWASVL
jgi:hypothetical protein